MAYQFVDTPRSAAGDRTHLSAGNLSFSEVQSPSKDPSRDLLPQARRNGSSTTRTPRARSALTNLRNPSARNEFTPLLKSAAHNRFRKSSANLQSHAEENENSTADIVNSMLATGPAAPATPAYLRSAHKNARHTPALPIESSMVDGEATGSSVGDATPLPPVVSSSAMLSSPMPTLATRGADARGDRKDVLTLRQQEVKLEKLDKENFALKLKIHFLDDMLTKTGTDYQQEIIKQNTELKVEKTTLTQDIRHQAKRLAKADKELLDYRQQLHEYAEKVKRRHTDEIMKEEMDRLRQEAEENKRLVENRDREIESLQQKLDLADKGSGDKAQELRDEIADLEMELRQKEHASDEKDDQIDALEQKVKSMEAGQGEVDAMQADIADMEVELDEKDQEISQLKSQVQNAGDREKSTRKLRFDVGELETQLRDRNATIDERDDEIKTLRKQVDELQDSQSATIRQLQSDLKDKDRSLQQKSGEAQALQERLDTARGSWDAEAQQTDARLQERNNLVNEKETELRQTLSRLEERADEISQLKQSLQKTQQDAHRNEEEHTEAIQQYATQITELQAKLRSVNAEFDKEVDKKSEQIQAKDDEIRRLSVQLHEGKIDVEARRLTARIDELERQLEDSVQQRTQAEQEVQRLKDRLERAGSPSKKDSLIEQQATKIIALQKLCDEKECELEEIENELTDAETAAETHKAEVVRLQSQLSEAANDHSIVGHQGDEIRQMARLVKSLEDAKDAANDEVVVLETAADEAQAEMRELRGRTVLLENELTNLRAARDAVTPARERSDLRQRLRDVEAQSLDYQQQVQTLEDELDRVTARARNTTPMRERDSLKAQLTDAHDEIRRLERRIQSVEAEERVRGEVQSSSEVNELHSLLRNSKIEAETLSLQIKEQDKRIESLMRKEGEMRIQLGQVKIDLEERDAALAERDARIGKLSSRETDLRAQVQDLAATRSRLQELEEELEDRREGTTTHDRVEQRLRHKLRDTRAELDELQRQLELPPAKSADKTHEKEMRGLVKQIQFLRAKCGREERFRRDLVFSKDWFLMQIAMYNECNKADLRLLEDMGITPDQATREKRVSLKTVAWGIIATHRMQKKSAAWAGHKKVHESLLKKLEGLKNSKARQAVV